MNELIKIELNDNQEQVLRARELHETLGIKKHFSQWWEQQVSHLRLDEGIDFLPLKLESTGGRPGQDFHIKLDTAKHLAMISGGEKAHELRRYFIEVEKAWNNPDMVMARGLQLANRKLVSYEQQVVQLEAKIESDRPKVIFADAVAASKNSILVGELAKIIKQNGIDIGQNRLFAWLRDNGYLIKRSGTDYNSPSQYSMNLGLLEVKETVVAHADGHTTTNKTPKVTGKGQSYFINKFLEAKSNDSIRA